MPSARTATAPPRRQTNRKATPRPRRVASRGLRGRVRWDRVGRVSLLVVVAVVAGLYVQRGLAYFAVRSQAAQQRAIVHQLTRLNASLRAQQRSLELFGRLRDSTGLAEPLVWAERHAKVVQLFGRFPHRNAILGRESTAEEIAFLRTPGSRF